MGLRHQLLPAASGSLGPSLGSPRAGQDPPGGGSPAGLRRLHTQNGCPWEMLGEGLPQRLVSRSRGQTQQGLPGGASGRSPSLRRGADSGVWLGSQTAPQGARPALRAGAATWPCSCGPLARVQRKGHCFWRAWGSWHSEGRAVPALGADLCRPHQRASIRRWSRGAGQGRRLPVSPWSSPASWNPGENQVSLQPAQPRRWPEASRAFGGLHW